MDKTRMIEEVKAHEPTFLAKAKRKGYVCPKCGNGTGKDGDGITRDTSDKSGARFKCFKCGLSGDVLDLFGEAKGITSFEAKLSGACAYFGISKVASPAGKGHGQSKASSSPPEQPRDPAQEAPLDSPAYTEFFHKAHRDIHKTDYPSRRGLGPEIVARFKLGYVEAWKNPKAPAAVPASPRLIIPTSEWSYAARDTRERLTPKQKEYRMSKVGSVRIFNREALEKSSRPIFITEGEINAMSIMEVGGEALATGSAANVRMFLKSIEAKPLAAPVIIALDNDQAGERAARSLIEGLEGIGVSYIQRNVCGQHKDANDALLADRSALAAAVAEAEEEGVAMAEKEKEAVRKEYQKNSAASHLPGFLHGISASVNTINIETGFAALDVALDGGLYEGLYVVGAISSLGKTSLITQMADGIAQGGFDVLFMSLEMARTEIMAKSISRHTSEIVLGLGLDLEGSAAKTTRGITSGRRYAGYSEAEKALIDEAVQVYGKYAGRIFISEGLGDMGTDQVREQVENHAKIMGRPPVVFVDYLQILAPNNPRATDKQATDRAVLELKKISRDFKTPVIAVSSFNRANYRNAVTMEAFKESGAVEYSADVLIGLQLEGAGEKEFDENKAKDKFVRSIELVVLKNRNGKMGTKINFKYYPWFNLFQEMPRF